MVSPSVSIDHIHTNATTGATSCEADSSGFTVIVGILIGLGSSVILNIGQNLQALGQQMARGKSIWAIGLALFIAGSIGNMVAMAFASASILVPLESSQFVTNIFFSKLVLKKRITARQWSGTALAVLGTVLTCVFGPNDARCFTAEEMASFWLNPVWLVYLVGSIACAAGGWLAYWRLRAHSRRRSPFEDAVVLPALFAVSSALLGGAQMIVHSKALAELFDMLAGGAETLPSLLVMWFFWVELLITAACGIFWAVQMDRSLGLYDPLFIIPLLQSSYITLGATASGIYFQEFATLHESGFAGPVGTWALFLLGMVMIVLGILLLAPVKRGSGAPLDDGGDAMERETSLGNARAPGALPAGAESGYGPGYGANYDPDDGMGGADKAAAAALTTSTRINRGHARSGSRGKGMGGMGGLTLSTLAGGVVIDDRSYDPEGRALVVDDEASDGAQSRAAASHPARTVGGGLGGGAGLRITALETNEVVLDLNEGEDEIQQVAEDLGDGGLSPGRSVHSSVHSETSVTPRSESGATPQQSSPRSTPWVASNRTNDRTKDQTSGTPGAQGSLGERGPPASLPPPLSSPSCSMASRGPGRGDALSSLSPPTVTPTPLTPSPLGTLSAGFAPGILPQASPLEAPLTRASSVGSAADSEVGVQVGARFNTSL